MRLCKYFIVSAAVLLLVSCREQQWDEHGKTTVEGANIDLLDALGKNPEITAFYEALVKTGYDKLLTEGNSFTVLAPTNAAWQVVETNDMESLAKTVANHIAYNKRTTADEMLFRELMLVSGKVLRYPETESFGISGAQITQSCDHIAGNGVYHVIDRIINLKLNIWEHIVDELAPDYAQANFLKRDCMRDEIDMKRSVRIGVHPQTAQDIYDTVWMKVNSFLLDAVPLDDEMKVFTYVVLQDEGFNYLHQKFRPFYRRTTERGTDSLARFNVCADLVFPGIVDIAAADTLINLFGYKVALTGDVVGEPYMATNGRVYILNRSNIHYRERIRPVYIDGTDYTGTNLFSTASNNRFDKVAKPWAGGSGEIVRLRVNYTQRDTIRDADGIPLECRFADADSTRALVWHWGTQEINNFSTESRRIHGYIEYKAELYSGQYEIHYKAYLDSEGGFRQDNSLTEYPMIHFQKFFISMPDAPRLRHGNGGSRPPSASTRPADIASVPLQNDVWSLYAIENNFLGPDTCFVTRDTVFVERERKMTKWRLKFSDTFIRGNTDPTASNYSTERVKLPQFVKNEVPEPDAHILKVPRTGELTMWLTNTASNQANYADGVEWDRSKGPLALDYIRLVPILPEED